MVQALTDQDPSPSHGIPQLPTDYSNMATSYRSTRLADYVTILFSLFLVVLS